ncbi:MAG TPA: glutathione synthase [Candidatus Binatia bacterium]|nr:glutathione synthase [Candidatus Binatia bacterium]
MSRTLGVVMDPIGSIKPYKDTTLALMLAAQARGWTLLYMELPDLWLRDGAAYGRVRPVKVRDDAERWHELGEPQVLPLGDLDAILMRKDPPFDMTYVAATYVLERAEESGALVVNRPGSLRDANEKAFISWFPQCCAPTLVTASIAELRAFHAEHRDIVVKPLDGMGGTSIFRVAAGDANASVIFETLTASGARYCMAQLYLPAIAEGDKRILMVDGAPLTHCLARIPRAGETRGNLAAGGHGETRPLTDRDRWIAAQVGPKLREMGLLFVGLDVIGDHLTEINVTSPTCAREIARDAGVDAADLLIAAVEARLQ